MTELKRLYYTSKDDLPTGFLRSRRAAVRRLMEYVASEMSSRMDILELQKRSHEEHQDLMVRYRERENLRNAHGEAHILLFNRLLSDLKNEARTLDLRAWQDLAPLRKEMRYLMREDLKLVEKERILGDGKTSLVSDELEEVI